jgi:hypothetical protein
MCYSVSFVHGLLLSDFSPDADSINLVGIVMAIAKEIIENKLQSMYLAAIAFKRSSRFN